MDLGSLVKIIEISPLIGLTVVFSFVLYKIGSAYFSFVNKILEKYSNDVQKLHNTIETFRQEERNRDESVITKLDNFRQMVSEEFDEAEKSSSEQHSGILRRLDELHLEILRALIGGGSSSEINPEKKK